MAIGASQPGFRGATNMATEKRAEQRFPARIPLVYAAGNRRAIARFQGNSQTIDISRSGLRFTIYHPVSQGHLLGLVLYPTRARKILELKAEVRWIRSFNGQPRNEVGTRFLGLEPSHGRRLARLLAETLAG